MKLMKIFMALTAMAVILVSCGEKPDPEQIVKKDPSIKISPLDIPAMNAAGGSVNISVTANMDWVVTGMPDWITVDPSSGEGSLYKQAVVVTVDENKAGAREAVLTFAVEGLSKDIKITQNHAFGPDAPADAVFFESFKTSKGNFTIEDVTRPDGLAAVWEHTSQYSCMKATAYYNNKNLASESWLVSPEIDLAGQSAAYFTFDHAGLYFGNISQEATVWISKNGGEWKQLEIASENYPSSWTFVSAGNWNLAEYLGSKVKFGFRYTSTATKAGTWEVANVAVIAGTFKDTTVPQVDPTKTAWMELPATDNKDLRYIAHRFEMDSKIYRNYTVGWSQNDLVSLWVAYPLNKTYTQKNVERTDAWAYDPVLGKDLSAAPFSGYAGDYARGHQLPSADRLCSAIANKQTFYGTNIAPQLNEHNEGIWSDLETYVRTIANDSDTTYVVTGCLVEGATEFSTDSDKKAITIPVAFYKALLRYKKGAETEWSCAGFYTDHKQYKSSNLKDVAMSIDELEKKTGFDFFVNLADKIGKNNADALEALDPATVALWNL